MEDEEDPLALTFIKCENQGNLHLSGDTEEEIIVSERSYNLDGVDTIVKTEAITESEGNLHLSEDTEEEIIESELSYNLDGVNTIVKAEDITESEILECNGIGAVDYSTDTASEISNVQEDITDLSHKTVAVEKIPHSGNSQKSQNNVVHTRKETLVRSTHYVCDICSKIIKGKFAFKSHINTHSGERPFSCSICNKTFARKRVLQEHALLHTGERPFKCDICEKSFAKKGTLIKHKVVHTGDRKHSCDICNKHFAQRSGLMKHRVTHTGERPYSCNFCEKAFTVRSGLKRHTEKVHLDESNVQSKCNEFV